MTDRELLELAYRAYAPGENYIRMVNVAGPGYWNPLTDSGQALELAVKLRIDVIQTNIRSPQVHALADVGMRVAGIRVSEDIGDDPLAATRRAIVRAAAEIGKEMK